MRKWNPTGASDLRCGYDDCSEGCDRGRNEIRGRSRKENMKLFVRTCEDRESMFEDLFSNTSRLLQFPNLRLFARNYTTLQELGSLAIFAVRAQ